MNNPYKVEEELLSLLKDRNKWRLAHDFRQYNTDEFLEKMQLDYNYLYTTSETLFKSAFDGMFDTPAGRDRIKHMLTLMKDIYNGNRKQDDVDKLLGNELAEEYVNPIINKLEKP